MTAVIVCVALIAVNIAYTIADGRSFESECEMEDYRRVEFKKSYDVERETTHVIRTMF